MPGIKLCIVVSVNDDFIVSIDNQFGSQSCFAVASSQFGKVIIKIQFIL